MWDLVPWPGIEPSPPESGVQSLSHWTIREFPVECFIHSCLFNHVHCFSVGLKYFIMITFWNMLWDVFARMSEYSLCLRSMEMVEGASVSRTNYVTPKENDRRGKWTLNKEESIHLKTLSQGHLAGRELAFLLSQ